jgi:sRNA-binding protein
MTKTELIALAAGDRVVVTLHNPERTYFGRVEAKTDDNTGVVAGLEKNRMNTKVGQKIWMQRGDVFQEVTVIEVKTHSLMVEVRPSLVEETSGRYAIEFHLSRLDWLNGKQFCVFRYSSSGGWDEIGRGGPWKLLEKVSVHLSDVRRERKRAAVATNPSRARTRWPMPSVSNPRREHLMDTSELAVGDKVVAKSGDIFKEGKLLRLTEKFVEVELGLDGWRVFIRFDRNGKQPL